MLPIGAIPHPTELFPCRTFGLTTFQAQCVVDGDLRFFFARASRWLGPNTQTPRLAEVGVVQKGIGACYTIQSTMQELLTSFLRFAGAVAAEVLGVLCRICTDEATDEVTGATR